MSNYYHYEVDMIDTDAYFRERPMETTISKNKTIIHDDYSGEEKKWVLGGIEIHNGISRSDLERLFDGWWDHGGYVAKITVTDNGENGDGIWLTFRSHLDALEDIIYLSIKLKPVQANILGTALINISKMRKAQEE